MILVNDVASLRKHLEGCGEIGFVPTMGFLHRGHVSLLYRAKENDTSVMSIYVNASQFGRAEDYDAYPRDLDRDLRIAEGAGVDFVFVPSVEEMAHDRKISSGRLGQISEGARRPGHFDAVANVVYRLFTIVGPEFAYFGQKDAQQVAVVRQMVQQEGLPVRVVGCPTVREPDGLAMSSRNVHLSDEQRLAAPVIFRALSAARRAAHAGSPAAELTEVVEREFKVAPLLRLEYAEVVDPRTFEKVEKIAGQATIVLAAWAGDTRLIDNIEIDVGTG